MTSAWFFTLADGLPEAVPVGDSLRVTDAEALGLADPLG
jgi:hypothetical protein